MAMQVGSLTVVAAAALDLATVHLTAKGRQETAPVLPATLDGFCRHEHMESHGITWARKSHVLLVGTC